MVAHGRTHVEELYAALAASAFERAAELYADDGELVRYDGAARGRPQIREFFERSTANHGSYRLREISQFRAIDDVVLWDALVDTDHGILMTSDVAIVDADGNFARHIPAIRGYWGQ